MADEEPIVLLRDRRNGHEVRALFSKVDWLLAHHRHYEVVDQRALERLRRASRQEADNGALVGPVEDDKPGAPELPAEVRAGDLNAAERGLSQMHFGKTPQEEDFSSDQVSVRVVPIRFGGFRR